MAVPAVRKVRGVRMGRPRPGGTSRWDLLVISVAVASVGLGAVLLAGAVSSSSSGTVTSSSTLAITLPRTVWALLFLAPLLVGSVALLIRLAAYRTGPLLSIVVALLVVFAFILFTGPWDGQGSILLNSGSGTPASTGGNGTGNGTGSGSGSGSGNGSGGTGGNGSGGGTGGGSGGTGGGGTGGGGGQGGGNSTGGGTGNTSGGGGGNSTGGGTGNSTGGGGTGGGGTGGGGNSTGGGTGNSTGGGGAGGGGTGGGGTGNGTGGGATGSNSSGSGSPGVHGTGSGNNTSHPVSGIGSGPEISTGVPPWVAMATALGLCVVLVLLALPGVVTRLADRRGRRIPRDPPLGTVSGPAAGPIDWARVERALNEAEASIARGEDPREAVVRLYNSLLRDAEPRIGNVETATAREIDLRRLRRYGVPANVSEALTHLFEEARYSSHRIVPAQATSFAEAIRTARTDLARGALPG